MKNEVRLVVNRLIGYAVGQVIKCVIDSDGVIVDRFWRRRLRDAKRDNCVQLDAPKPERKSKVKPTDEVENGDSN